MKTWFYEYLHFRCGTTESPQFSGIPVIIDDTIAEPYEVEYQDVWGPEEIEAVAKKLGFAPLSELYRGGK